MRTSGNLLTPRRLRALRQDLHLSVTAERSRARGARPKSPMSANVQSPDGGGTIRQGWHMKLIVTDSQLCCLVTISWPARSWASVIGCLIVQATSARQLGVEQPSSSPTQICQVGLFAISVDAATVMPAGEITWFQTGFSVSVIVSV